MCFQGKRHFAAEYPNGRNECRTGNDCENQSGELQFPDVLNKVVLGRQQQYVGVVSLTQGDLRQPEQVALALVVTDISFIVVETIRPSQHCRRDPGTDLLDIG